MIPQPADLLRSWLRIHPYTPNVPPAVRRQKVGAGARGLGVAVLRRNGTHKLPAGWDTHGLKPEERAALEEIEALHDRIRRALDDLARHRRQTNG
jgi:hypothetical protein